MYDVQFSDFFIFRIVYRDPQIQRHLDQLYCDKLQQEIRKATSKNTPSSLKKKDADSLLQISPSAIIKEWQDSCPTFER